MTARLTFLGGQLVVPVHAPYDRQLLIEHVHALVRPRQQLRLRIDHGAWLIETSERKSPLSCHDCSRPINGPFCRRSAKSAPVFCLECALLQPHLTITMLMTMPPETILCDVQARYAFGSEWVSWMRWPQASPAQIIEDIHLQRRFAPVLTWRCAEIRLPAGKRKAAVSHPMVANDSTKRANRAL